MIGIPDRNRRVILEINDQPRHGRAVFGFVRPAALLLSVLYFCFLATACVRTVSPFPKVTQPSGTEETGASASSSATSQPTETTDGKIVLRVAAPLSNTTVQYLLKLFEAKKSGTLEEGVTGSNVSLDTLDDVEPSFTVELLQTPSTGATDDTISQWEQSGLVPDVICTNSLSALAKNGDILPLNRYLSSNPLIQPSRIYLSMLNACSIGSELYGIPYAASAQMLFVNNDIAKRAGRESVPFNMDLDALMSFSASVNALSNEATPLGERIFAFYDISELLPFLPSAFDSAAGWFMYDGTSYRFGSASFEAAVSFLREYHAAAYSVESLSPEDQNAAFGTLDPRLSGRVGIWAGSTDEISLWTKTPWKISIAQMPSASAQAASPLALTVYPYCISKATAAPQLACDFAAFMALDEDAQLLAGRLETGDGLLPATSSDAVWKATVESQTFGSDLMLLKDRMQGAYYNPITGKESASLLIRQMIAEYKDQILDKSVDFQEVVSLLQNAGSSAAG